MRTYDYGAVAPMRKSSNGLEKLGHFRYHKHDILCRSIIAATRDIPTTLEFYSDESK